MKSKILFSLITAGLSQLAFSASPNYNNMVQDGNDMPFSYRAQSFDEIDENVVTSTTLENILNSFQYCPPISRVLDREISAYTSVQANGNPDVKSLPDLQKYNGTSAYRLRQIIQKLLTTYGIILANEELSTLEKQLAEEVYKGGKLVSHSVPIVLIDLIIGNTKKSTNILKKIITFPLEIAQTAVSMGNNKKTTKSGQFYVTIETLLNRKFGMFGKTNPIFKISFAYLQDGNETPFFYRAHNFQDIEKNYNYSSIKEWLNNNATDL